MAFKSALSLPALSLPAIQCYLRYLALFIPESYIHSPYIAHFPFKYTFGVEN